MKNWKNKLVPILCAIIVVSSLVPAVKRVVKGEPLDGVAVTFLCVAVAFLVVGIATGRKSGGGPGPPSA